jgi:hypothetical protein
MSEMTATNTHQLVAFFWRAEDLKQALARLRSLNFDTRSVILGSRAGSVQAHDEGLPAFGEALNTWCQPAPTSESAAIVGSGIGGVLGVVAGLGLLGLPAVGPWLMGAGPAAIAFETTLHALTGAAVGDSLGAATQKNIEDDERRFCEQLLNKGYLMLVACSDAHHIRQAAQQLKPLALHLRTRNIV